MFRLSWVKWFVRKAVQLYNFSLYDETGLVNENVIRKPISFQFSISDSLQTKINNFINNGNLILQSIYNFHYVLTEKRRAGHTWIVDKFGLIP